MKLIVGLGNPGKKYKGTPHNVGFATVDELAKRWSCRTRRSLRFQARLGKCVRDGESLALLKPETFMNNSGLSVSKALCYWKISASDLILVLDDADLAIGRIRIRPKGSSGGHRGLDSVIRHIDGSGFMRVRIGIGRGDRERDLVSHVLSPFSAAERRQMDEEIQRAADAVECLLDNDDATAAMNRFNGFAPVPD